MRFWYEEKIDNRIKENLFKKVLKECNEIQLVYLENRDKTETAKKIMKLLNPFVIEQKKSYLLDGNRNYQ